MISISLDRHPGIAGPTSGHRLVRADPINHRVPRHATLQSPKRQLRVEDVTCPE
jgi:hypothetical protein